MSYNNPKIIRQGKSKRKQHKTEYYTAGANITVSRNVKLGLVNIAEMEDRSLSWVVNEVFRYYFGLKDDTEIIGIGRKSKIRRVK